LDTGGTDADGEGTGLEELGDGGGDDGGGLDALVTVAVRSDFAEAEPLEFVPVTRT
jgi:hypothetical protein